MLKIVEILGVKILNIFHKENKLMERAAYHEGGHIVMAYMSGYHVEQTYLDTVNIGDGFTLINYGNDIVLVAAVINSLNNRLIFNDLSPADRARSPQIAFSQSNILIGGPVAESLHRFGVGNDGILEIDMAGPDLVRVENIHHFLTNIDPTHRTDFIVYTLRMITSLMRLNDFWNPVNELSNALLQSDTKSLNREQIEHILRSSGYFDYLTREDLV